MNSITRGKLDTWRLIGQRLALVCAIYWAAQAKGAVNSMAAKMEPVNWRCGWHQFQRQIIRAKIYDDVCEHQPLQSNILSLLAGHSSAGGPGQQQQQQLQEQDQEEDQTEQKLGTLSSLSFSVVLSLHLFLFFLRLFLTAILAKFILLLPLPLLLLLFFFFFFFFFPLLLFFDSCTRSDGIGENEAFVSLFSGSRNIFLQCGISVTPFPPPLPFLPPSLNFPL